MSSLNALKYKVSVSPSYYAGVIIFLLYSVVILLTLLVTAMTFISFFLYLILFTIAFYVARQTYLLHDQIRFSYLGAVEREQAGKIFHGVISGKSFYNQWFIFLRLDVKHVALSAKNIKQVIFIYKDAISEEDFRLIAQVINNRRN